MGVRLINVTLAVDDEGKCRYATAIDRIDAAGRRHSPAAKRRKHYLMHRSTRQAIGAEDMIPVSLWTERPPTTKLNSSTSAES